MTSRGESAWFAASTLGLYGLFSIATVPTASHMGLVEILSAVVNQVAILGIALELSELILAAALPAPVHPKVPMSEPLQAYVAVLYCCCDDADPIALQALQELHGADIFLLDDSEGADDRTLIDNTKFAVIRRGTRKGVSIPRQSRGL